MSQGLAHLWIRTTGERWVACCHQKFFIGGAYDKAEAVAISLGAILLSLLSMGDIWHCPQTLFVIAPRAESATGTQWEQAKAALECSTMHRAAPKQRITWPAMLIVLTLKACSSQRWFPGYKSHQIFSQKLFLENLALKLIFSCYCNKLLWPTWLKWYRFYDLVLLKVSSLRLSSRGDDKEAVVCHSQPLKASYCLWFVELTSQDEKSHCSSGLSHIVSQTM